MRNLRQALLETSKVVLQFVKTAEITTLILIPITVGMAILIGGMRLAINHYGKEPPEKILMILVAILCVFVSLSGVIQIYRRETYGIFGHGRKNNWTAVAIGWLIVASSAMVFLVLISEIIK